MSTSGFLRDLIARSDFQNTGDFLRSRSGAVVDVDDVRELLEIYEQELLGEVRRKKFNKKKIERVEHSLTPRGVKKLSDARKTLRMHIEASQKKKERSEKLPPIPKESLTEHYGFDDGPDEFIHKMHGWGKFPIDDRRYYLHMVFRYYFKRYHDRAVAAGTVIPHPSYQYILDTLHPNDCANRFPPEFRRFLDDSSGRTIVTVSLPVPLKGSSTEVTYDYNFETIPYVSTLRRKIEETTRDWVSRKYKVYPSYLCKGDPQNESVVERECYSRKIRVVQRGLRRLVNVDLERIQSVGTRVPTAFVAYDDYMLHEFKTTGEQLKERMGFFMMSKYRRIFFELEESSFVENLFVATDAGMEVFVSFQTFCTQKAKGKTMGFEKDENLCRALLMVLVDVCFFFHVVKNRELVDEDHVKVLSDFVGNL